MSYGVTAQLQDERKTTSPIIELIDRDRYDGLELGRPPDLTQSGLVVDLARRIDPARLGRCFAKVRPLGRIDRSGQAYAVFGVSGPKRDILKLGC